MTQVPLRSEREEALDLIQRLPEGVSLETILAELHFKLEVIRGLSEIARGEGVSDDEAKRRLSRWLE